MNLRKIILPLALLALGTLASCGQSAPVVQKWTIANSGTALDVAALLDPSYEINGEGVIAFKNYGSINISQANNGQSSIEVSLNTNAFIDVGLQPVTTLPTGAAFPSIVQGAMNAIDLQNDLKKWDVQLYLSHQTDSDGTNRALVGVSIASRGVSTSFSGLTLTQNYFNSNNLKFAAVSFYGPKLDTNGNTLVPGGVFLVADVNQLISSPHVGSELEVTGSNAAQYQSPEAKQRLAYEFLKSAEEAGLIRRH